METITGSDRMNEIVEYHCCSDCKKQITIPTDDLKKWQCGCTDKRGKPNPAGGLSRCEYFQEKEE